MSAAALEAFYKELLCGITVGQNRQTYQDPAVVEDSNSVLSQKDQLLGVKKQLEGTKAYTSFAEYKPTPGQPSRTPSPQAAVQADLPQRLPVTPRTNNP